MDIPIHPSQKKFLQSNAVFRGFVGGIGSGKSWVGACDLIYRSRPGRLYLVAAPSYPMLADATIRSFLQVARMMGLDDIVGPDGKPREEKINLKIQPPWIRLPTGAEVIFRSADDPERLRGPNLSGVWMDEASLMKIEAFNILIGRLREGGEQGWLSATFTPKGKLHWTYEVFGGERQNTAIFHARTRDNPFLPPAFHDTVRQQYTSTLAAQELEGEFLDTGGALFQRRWFGVVEALPKIVRSVRAWDLAATPKNEEKANDPDWTAGVKIGTDGLGTYFIEDVRRVRATPQQVKTFVRQTAEEDGRDTRVWMEQEPGASGKIVVDDFCRLLAGFAFNAETSSGSKADRARPFAAQAEGGAVKLLRGSWNRDFLNEIEAFPFGPHDDMVDAAANCFNRIAVRKVGLFRESDVERLEGSEQGYGSIAEYVDACTK